MKPIFIFIVLSAALSIGCHQQPGKYHSITETDYVNKMKAGWIGQMVGVGWAAPTEFRYVFRIMPADQMPAWKDSAVNQYHQDDLYVEMTFLRTLEEHGLDVSRRRAGIDFANSLYGLACANDAGRENLRAGIAPPESGHPDFSFNSDDIDYQIEADYSGLISPGMPNRVIALGEKFGKLMNYGDGVYGGVFMGGMYAASFFEHDRQKIVEAGLACIPAGSDYARCVRDVMQWYREDTLNWQNTWKKIDAKYVKDSTYQKLAVKNKKSWPGIDAKLNGAYVLLGLLYGRGNPDSTIVIAARAGLDSDCNPSSAAGILFTAIGYQQLPRRFTGGLDTGIKFEYTAYDFDALVAACTNLCRQQVKKTGGKIKTDNNGQVYYLIPKEKPIPAALEQSYNPALPDKANIFSAGEMEQIQVHPARSYDRVMRKVAPGWRAGNCSRALEAEFFNWRGQDSVAALLPVNAQTPCYLMTEVALPAGKKSALKLSVSNEPGEEWLLDIKIQWYTKTRVLVNDKLCQNGWHTVFLDLSEYQDVGRLFIQVNALPRDNRLTKTYWQSVELVSE
jgi:hypothetical protein